jgi:uncharacterized membrane protein YcaP (DUF421 family)
LSITLVVVIRSVISFIILLLLVRLMGKQQVAQLTFFDYVVGITIGSIASTLSVQVNEDLLSTLAGLATWAALAIVLAVLSVHSARVRKIVDGEATVVIADGKILENNLKKIRIPIEQLISELRTQGVFSIADVASALFEPGGKISIPEEIAKPARYPRRLAHRHAVRRAADKPYFRRCFAFGGASFAESDQGLAGISAQQAKYPECRRSFTGAAGHPGKSICRFKRR